jgi:hypothetical protein
MRKVSGLKKRLAVSPAAHHPFGSKPVAGALPKVFALTNALLGRRMSPTPSLSKFDCIVIGSPRKVGVPGQRCSAKRQSFEIVRIE